MEKVIFTLVGNGELCLASALAASSLLTGPNTCHLRVPGDMGKRDEEGPPGRRTSKKCFLHSISTHRTLSVSLGLR